MSAARTVSMGDEPKTILVVDGEEDPTQSLARMLGEEGYSVLEARNGAEAMDTLKNASKLPDLVIMDLLMSTMDAWKFRHLQKQDAKFRSIPVIGVTSTGATANVDADLILHRPVDVEFLLRAIQHFC